MTSTIFLRQLRLHAALLGAIMLGLVLFELLMVWIASSLEIGPEFMGMLEMLLPEAMLNFITSQFGFTSFANAVAFGFKHPLVIVTGVAFPIVVATIPAAERESGLLDLLLARPVPRERYLAAHVLLLVVGAVAIPLALLIGATSGLALTAPSQDVAWHSYLAPAFAYTPLLLLVGAYTFFFATGARRRGTAVAQAAGLTLVFFWYEVLSTMWDRLDGYEWLTIFYYYAPVSTLNGQHGAREPLILLGLATLVIGAAFWRFRRQQL